MRSRSLTRPSAAFQAAGPTLSRMSFRRSRWFVPARRPGVIGEHRAKAHQLLMQMGEAGMVTGVDMGVAAGQAE